MQELHRLEAMPPMSAEGTVSRTYIDWLVSVPWKQKSKEIRDLTKAEEVLHEDHFGLEKIKERILEYLAVRQLVKNPKAQFSVSLVRRWEKRVSASRLLVPPVASSCVFPWAVFVMKLRSVVIDALTLAPCPARSFK